MATALALGACPATAATTWVPDRPIAVRQAKGAAGTVECTCYRDLMIRVGGMDTPSPDAAQIVPVAGLPPACAAAPPKARTLDTGGFAFRHRTGPYLFFEEADPNGSIAFAVVDARTGATIVDDVTLDGPAARGGLTAVVAAPATLTLGFRRALNLPCSILAAPGACRGRTVRDPANATPAEVATLPPPVAACRRSYARTHVAADDPAIIAYDARLTWTRGRPTVIRGTGPVDCLPLP